MLQTSQMTSESPIPDQKIPPQINVLMPQGMFGFEAINQYTMTPLFPEKGEWAYWRLIARNFGEEDCDLALYENKLYPNSDTLSFILLALEHLNIGGITIQGDDIKFCLKSLNVPYEECIVFMVISLETDEGGRLINMTANVKAPLIFHSVTKQAWQIILSEGPDCSYPISLPLMGC